MSVKRALMLLLPIVPFYFIAIIPYFYFEYQAGRNSRLISRLAGARSSTVTQVRAFIRSTRKGWGFHYDLEKCPLKGCNRKGTTFNVTLGNEGKQKVLNVLPTHEKRGLAQDVVCVMQMVG